MHKQDSNATCNVSIAECEVSTLEMYNKHYILLAAVQSYNCNFIVMLHNLCMVTNFIHWQCYIVN